MDRKLRNELNAIARDRTSGAAELTLRATHVILSRLVRQPQPPAQELVDVARLLLRAQPSMAPMLRLANEVAWGIDFAETPAVLAARISRFRRALEAGPARIAQHFRESLKNKEKAFVQTFSYSSTVLRALIAARSRLEKVWCSESRPGNEGQATTQKLARAGIKVVFSTDACMFGQIWDTHTVMLGADAVLKGWVAGKVGVRTIVDRALACGAPVIFAADTTKFWAQPTRSSPRWRWKFGPEEEVWSYTHKNVEVYNLYFELVPYRADSRIRFLTERGWMTPAQVRRAIDKIKVSPRLMELAD